MDESLQCLICMNLCERPVTSPCQHNFCLKCFNNWVQRPGNDKCPKCRTKWEKKFYQNPRVNTALVVAIRMAKRGDEDATAVSRAKKLADANSKRKDYAAPTENAQRSGLANAASGKLFVNCPADHFGPIGPEFDLTGKNRGLVVCDTWQSRLECRQYGAHFPHVAGIAGQSNFGSQSVVLAGGYEDDVDNGDWFLYTGSGGRDLSGNKRTNKEQGFDQEFAAFNKALQLSCTKGYPVRVVRSYKDKHSQYAPARLIKDPKNPKKDKDPKNLTTPVRYDGTYRITKCWRTPGNQGMLVCRYLFVRCDNEPAPWSSEDVGDKAIDEPEVKELAKIFVDDNGTSKIKFKYNGRSSDEYYLPILKEMAEKDTWDPSPKDGAKFKTAKRNGLAKLAQLQAKKKVAHKGAETVYMCKEDAAWQFDPVTAQWGWAPGKQPKSEKLHGTTDKQNRKEVTEAGRLLRDFACCFKTKTAAGNVKHVLVKPVTTPCGCQFCLDCICKHFERQEAKAPARGQGSRSLRAQKVVKPCPVCKTNIADLMENPQVNREMEAIIKGLQEKAANKDIALALDKLDTQVDEIEAAAKGEFTIKRHDAALLPESRAAVGTRVGIWADIDKCFYYAKVVAYRGTEKGPEYHVLYEVDNEKEWIRPKENALDFGANPSAAEEPAGAEVTGGAAEGPTAAPGAPRSNGHAEDGAQPMNGSSSRDVPSRKKAKQSPLDALIAEFPQLDAAFITDLYNDQEGDVKDVRNECRMLTANMETVDKKEAAAKRKAEAAAASPAAGKKGRTDGPP